MEDQGSHVEEEVEIKKIGEDRSATDIVVNIIPEPQIRSVNIKVYSDPVEPIEPIDKINIPDPEHDSFINYLQRESKNIHCCLLEMSILNVGDLWFSKVHTFNLENMDTLSEIKIGQNSFTEHPGGYSYDDNSFSVSNCKVLKSIEIGCFSFNSFNSFQLESLPSLESLVIGSTERVSNNFWYSPFVIKG